MVHANGGRELAVVPESPESIRSGAGALVHVEVKPAKKGEVLVFPPFMGKAPKKLLKEDSGTPSLCALLLESLGHCSSVEEMEMGVHMKLMGCTMGGCLSSLNASGVHE